MSKLAITNNSLNSSVKSKTNLPSYVEPLDIEQWGNEIRKAFGSFALDQISEEDFTGSFLPRNLGMVDMTWISGNLKEIVIHADCKKNEDDFFMVANYGCMTDMAIGNDTVHLKHGSFVFVPPKQEHTMRFNGAFKHLSMRLPRHYIDDVLGCFVPDQACVLDRSHNISESLRSLLLLLTPSAKESNTQEESEAMLNATLELIAGGLRMVARRNENIQSTLSESEQRILNRSLELIEKRCTEPDLNIDNLAAYSAVSRRTLQRIFNRAGLSVSHAIQTERLRHAWNILRKYRKDNVSITEVAFDCGFNSVSYFNRAFRARYGVSPGKYKRDH